MDPTATPPNPFAHPEPPAQTPTEPSRGTPLDLLFRPTRFFENGRHLIGNGPLAILVLLLGMAHAMDRLETKAIAGNVNPVLSSWGQFFGAVALAGAIGGLLIYAILGWFYHLRVRWAGDSTADPAEARRIYVVAGMIRAVPLVLISAIESLIHPTPAMALQSRTGWEMGILLFVVWSQVASYKGVRAAFDVGKWRARIWFLFLPWLTIAVGLVLVVVGYMLISPNIPPDTVNTRDYDGPAFAVTYPGNWEIVDRTDGYDPLWAIAVMPPQDAAITLSLYYADGEEPAQLAADQLDADVAEGFRLIKSERTTRWGRQNGEGVSATCEYDGSRYRLDHFAYPIGDGWVVLVREACLEESYKVVRPGFRTVRDSIEPRSPAHRPPDLARPETIRAGGVRFDIPGDWQKLVTDGDHAIFVEVHPPQDAYLSMTVYSSDLTIGDEADLTIDAYRVPENEVVDGEPFTTWGRWTGAGRRATVRPDGDDLYEIEVFVAELGDGRYLEVESSILPAQADYCRDGFDLIRDSMRAE